LLGDVAGFPLLNRGFQVRRYNTFMKWPDACAENGAFPPQATIIHIHCLESRKPAEWQVFYSHFSAL
jgi:hypothetical protein